MTKKKPKEKFIAQTFIHPSTSSDTKKKIEEHRKKKL